MAVVCDNQNGLLPWHKVPEEARERYILSGYRPDKKFHLTSCLASAFKLHNETLNIWTHTLPMIYFIYFSYASLDCAGVSGLTRGDLYPFYGYILGVCCLFGTSSFAHLVTCLAWKDVCFMLDYSAICLYGVGTAIAFYAYSSPKDLVGIASNPEVFLTVSVLLALIACLTCCSTRVYQTQLCHLIRTCSFVAPFLYGSIPAISRCLYDDQVLGLHTPATPPHIANDSMQQNSSSIAQRILFNFEHPEKHSFTSGYIWHFGLMASAALVNVSRMPERLFPGMFDLIGHSHQWFHALIFLGIREQFWVTISDISRRAHNDEDPKSLVTATYGQYLEPSYTITCFVIMVVVQALIVIVSRAKLSSSNLKYNGENGLKDGTSKQHFE